MVRIEIFDRYLHHSVKSLRKNALSYKSKLLTVKP